MIRRDPSVDGCRHQDDSQQASTTVSANDASPSEAPALQRRVAADVEGTVAGPIGITDDAVARAPGNVTFVGAVPRDRVSALYRAADVVVLPTLLDGFGITQVNEVERVDPVGE